ncbi:WXG100 family type VII secretion target [Crossiella sp. NPDC003009]
MSGKTRQNADGIRAGAGRLSRVGDDLAKAATSLQSALTGEGQCWGNDESGQAFAKDYVPAADAVSKGIADVAQGLINVAKGLNDQATTMEQADTGSAANLKASGS